MRIPDLGRVSSIALKEVRHILRDPFTLAMALGMPAILVTFFGFIIDFNYRDIKIMVEDRDHSRASRELAETFSASGYFRTLPRPPGADPAKYLDSGKAFGVLILERDFGKHASMGSPAKAQLLIDVADNSKTGVILSYLSGTVESATKKISGAKLKAPVEIKTRFLFNPELNSQWFIIPGLSVIIIGLVSVLLTALTVAREWENGSMELLLSTPVRPGEIIAGKLAPYTVLGLGAVAFVYAAARLVFGVPFLGSLLVYGISCVLFLTVALAQGLLISVVTREQRLAMQFSIVSGLLPSMLLSGFIFPIESMNVFFRYLTFILPPRWFMWISRGIFLRGAGMLDILPSFAMLSLLGLVLISLAVKKFKSDLEP